QCDEQIIKRPYSQYPSYVEVSDDATVFNYLAVYFAVFVSTILLSYFSYHYFEKRFLDMKDKYSTIKSSG
ncbi:MAG: hypothetical protein ACKO7B_09835, partial [Flavobacteriales bacterium]